MNRANIKILSLILSLIISVIIIVCINNNNNRDDISLLVDEWMGKEFKFSNNIDKTEPSDSIFLHKETFKIVHYIDSLGCAKCKLQLNLWRSFMHEIKLVSRSRISVMFIVDGTVRESNNLLFGNNDFFYIVRDYNNVIRDANNIPSIELCHTLLLDQNNKVIMIGNPIKNHKIKKRYFKNLSKNLSEEY